MFKNLQHVVELCLRLDENCRKLFREEWEKNMKRIFFLVPYSSEEVLKHTAKTKHWRITDPTRKHWFHGVSFLLSMGNRVCFLGDKILICWFLEAALFTMGDPVVWWLPIFYSHGLVWPKREQLPSYHSLQDGRKCLIISWLLENLDNAVF